MAKRDEIAVLFWDIGGVLLTNAWDHNARARAAGKFGLDAEEFAERHDLNIGTYERGTIGLDEYLERVVFQRERPFSRREFRDYVLAQSQPLPDMLEMARALARRPGLRVGALSNDGRETTIYRVREFGLTDFIGCFVCSCFVGSRKPEDTIYRLALDLAQVKPEQAVYIDDRKPNCEAGRRFGIQAVHHRDAETTRRELGELGLSPA